MEKATEARRVNGLCMADTDNCLGQCLAFKQSGQRRTAMPPNGPKADIGRACVLFAKLNDLNREAPIVCVGAFLFQAFDLRDFDPRQIKVFLGCANDALT